MKVLNLFNNTYQLPVSDFSYHYIMQFYCNTPYPDPKYLDQTMVDLFFAMPEEEVKQQPLEWKKDLFHCCEYFGAPAPFRPADWYKYDPFWNGGTIAESKYWEKHGMRELYQLQLQKVTDYVHNLEKNGTLDQKIPHYDREDHPYQIAAQNAWFDSIAEPAPADDVYAEYE